MRPALAMWTSTRRWLGNQDMYRYVKIAVVAHGRSCLSLEGIQFQSWQAAFDVLPPLTSLQMQKASARSGAQ